MNYAEGILRGSALGIVAYSIGVRNGAFKSDGPMAGFGQLIYAVACTSIGGSLGFTAVALSRSNSIRVALGLLEIL